VIPDEVAQAHAQLNLDEKTLLYYLAKNFYTGFGDIIDAGAFLGGSATCLSCGLRDNMRVSDKTGRVHSFDNFRYSEGYAESWFGQKMVSGQNFRPIYEKYTAPYKEYLTVHQGNLEDLRWLGGDIELLFLDICKSTATTDRVAEIFFPFLVPGKSIVVQQDYLFLGCSIWDKVMMEILDRYFRRVTYCERNSVAYLCVKKVPVIHSLMSNCTQDQLIHLAYNAANRWPDRERDIVEQAIQLYVKRWVQGVV